MPTLTKRRALTSAAAAAVILLLAWLAWPAPVPVDLAAVARADMEVTVDEDARTRIRRIYTVSAPLTGTVLKPALEVGDSVVANATVVAVMQPAASGFHDPRLHQELQSALSAASAAVSLAEAERRRIEAALNFSRSELRRLESLADKGAVARSALEKAVAEVQTQDAALARASAELEVRRNERESAATRLQHPTGTATAASDPGCCVQIHAPVSGQLLKLMQESEAVVQAGTPLLDIGDPRDLEIVAELLSTDAMQVREGQAVHIDGWGGGSIEGRVRRIEPAGFMKVSALGIEEQRVRTLIDFADPPGQRPGLGHDYRVVVHVVTWKASDVLAVPVGALFRANGTWAVFRNDAGRARTIEIVVGQRNSRVAEVLSGLAEGEQVVLHAGDRVRDGTRITRRQ